MEIEDVNFSVRDLEMRTYRYLQQLAKSLCLPSNVKKVYLIQLIHAKKYKSEDEVNNMVQQVKSERQHMLQSKKKQRKRNLQNRDVTSTSKSCQSPPITLTPKRSVHPVLRYSPDFSYSVGKCSSGQNYQPPSNVSIKSIAGSDRVLRSFNLKSLRKSYRTVNLNNNITSPVQVRNQTTSPKENYLRIMNAGRKLNKINLNCTERIQQPSILSANSCLAFRNDKQYIAPQNPQVSLNREISVPQSKRQRTLSGIYPLIPQDMQYQSFDQIHGVKLRRSDGRLSTIKALVQKRSATEFKSPLKQNNEITIQEILSSIDVNSSNLTQSFGCPSTGYNFVNNICNPSVSESKENEDAYSEYYHKKIRSEQMGYRRMSFKEPEERLPKITDVFSKFNCVPNRSVVQPLYVQVSEESERIPSHIYSGRNIASTVMLEKIFNFRTSLLTHAPLQQIATTTNTVCVYSTPVIATAMVQQSVPLIAHDPFNMPPYEPESQYRYGPDAEIPHLYELQRPPEQDASFRRFTDVEDMSTAVSPLSQAIIPVMVEDALEIISQDGDYMERIGMDIRVQCLLCSWAGAKIILEMHIRKEHPTMIHKQSPAERSIVYTLGALGARRLWLSEVLEQDEALCVLSAHYREPDCVVATLSSLSSDDMDKFGTITTYNKVTGEPYTWEGPILPLPSNLPYENDLSGLTVQLSKLDLLPNNANLTLLNKELVLKSPTEVVVGQPELNDIQIIFFVNFIKHSV